MISSTGDPALDNLPPFDERYSIDFIFGLPSNAVPHHAVDGAGARRSRSASRGMARPGRG